MLYIRKRVCLKVGTSRQISVKFRDSPKTLSNQGKKIHRMILGSYHYQISLAAFSRFKYCRKKIGLMLTKTESGLGYKWPLFEHLTIVQFLFNSCNNFGNLPKPYNKYRFILDQDCKLLLKQTDKRYTKTKCNKAKF